MGIKLMEACKERDLNKLKQLLKSSSHRATINKLYPFPGYSWSSTVLSYACDINTYDFVETLLVNGARDDIEDSIGCWAIHYACQSDTDTLAKVKLLAERNADNIHRITEQHTPLMLVNDHDTLEYLLQKGARVDDVEGDGQSALHYHYMRDAPTCINTLLKYGADVNLRNKDGDTPLHAAALNAKFEAVKALVASPACDVDLKNEKGQTALDIARSKPYSSFKYYDEIIQCLENINSHQAVYLGTRLRAKKNNVKH